LNFYNHSANAAQAISSELSQPRETPIARWRPPARCSNTPDQQRSACGPHHNAAITAIGGCRLRICSPIELSPSCAACIFGSSVVSSALCCKWRSSVDALPSISWPESRQILQCSCYSQHCLQLGLQQIFFGIQSSFDWNSHCRLPCFQKSGQTLHPALRCHRHCGTNGLECQRGQVQP